VCPSVSYVGTYIRVYVYVCSLIAREGINHFTPNLAYLCPETRRTIYKGEYSEKVSWVRVLVRVVSEAQ
jgi:hypothetical protein